MKVKKMRKSTNVVDARVKTPRQPIAPAMHQQPPYVVAGPKNLKPKK